MIKQGELIGEILIGSRAGVFVPSGYNIQVSVGERLVGGSTILLSLSQFQFF